MIGGTTIVPERKLVPPMTTIAPAELIAELDNVVKAGSPERRAQILRQVASLFLSGTGRLNEVHVGLFDDVLVRLIECAEPRTLAKLSATLADLTSAPPRQAIRRLAFHEDAAVAVAALRNSSSLTESDLMELAGNRGQQHLLAIAGRKIVSEPLTDVLVTRGETSVCRELAKNAGAQFSSRGFSAMIAAAKRDDDIAASLVTRSDLPAEMVRELVAKSARAVQARLLKIAPAEMRETLQAAIESVAADPGSKTAGRIDYSEAKSTVLALNNAGKLNDSSVNRFAVRGEQNYAVAALSLLAAVPIETIEQLMQQSDCCGVVIACRASRLDWQTALALINNRKGARKLSQREIERGKELFGSLSLSTAQRTIRYGSVRDVAMLAGSTGNALVTGEAS